MGTDTAPSHQAACPSVHARRVMTGYGLAWGMLILAATLAYTAWYSQRNGDDGRDVKALYFCSGVSLALGCVLAALVRWQAV